MVSLCEQLGYEEGKNPEEVGPMKQQRRVINSRTTLNAYNAEEMMGFLVRNELFLCWVVLP